MSSVHRVAHDLRSPLRAVYGLLQLVQADLEDVAQPETSARIDMVLGEIRRLDGFVEALIDENK